MTNIKKILVTGGAGFIGSALVRHLIDHCEHHVFNIDALTYAGNLSSLASVSKSDRYSFAQVDIRDAEALNEQFIRFSPDIVMHLAAESHVDRSIEGPAAFIETNLIGTFNMLSAALSYWRGLDESAQAAFRFHRKLQREQSRLSR